MFPTIYTTRSAAAKVARQLNLEEPAIARKCGVARTWKVLPHPLGLAGFAVGAILKDYDGIKGMSSTLYFTEV